MDKVYYCTVMANMFVKPEIVKVHAKYKEDAKKKYAEWMIFLVKREENILTPDLNPAPV